MTDERSRHSLLRRQIRRVFVDGAAPAALEPFLDTVNEAYRAFDSDRAMLERSLDLSSQELLQANAELRQRQAELTSAHAALERRVEERTRQLQEANQQLRAQMEERAAAEAQLRQAQKMDAVGRLAGGIAHDFNNLLTAVLGYAHLLIGALGPHPAAAHAEEIRRATHRASSLTRQLLAFSRRQRLSPVLVDLNHSLADISSILERLIGEHIQIEMQLAPGLGPVRVDPMQLEQVVLNLAINARDAMPGGGRLVFRTGEDVLTPERARAADVAPGTYIRLDVQDSGTGISAGDLAHVFEPFFTTKGPAEGTGLGLSTAYGILRQSGGAVTVEQTSASGTTFSVFLPRVAASFPPGPEPLAQKATPGPVAGQHRILVVEDEDSVRRLVGAVLSAEGYRPTLAANGIEALALLESPEVNVDLVLTDIVMPGINGRELAARLSRVRPDLPLLFMTGYAAGGESEPGLEGADVISKPFTPDALLSAVRSRIEKSLRAC